jgi:DDE superfamily endonuclease
VPTADERKLRNLADGFSISRTRASQLYGCIGALDGIAITVMKPPDDFCPRKLFCRKGTYSLPVQAIADYRYRFMYMSAKCVGSTHDSISFACSRLAQALQDGSALSAFWIAADATYDSSTCKGIITPWSKGKLSDPEHGLW